MKINVKKFPVEDIVDFIYQKSPDMYARAVTLMERRDRKGLIQLAKEVQ